MTQWFWLILKVFPCDVCISKSDIYTMLKLQLNPFFPIFFSFRAQSYYCWVGQCRENYNPLSIVSIFTKMQKVENRHFISHFFYIIYLHISISSLGFLTKVFLSLSAKNTRHYFIPPWLINIYLWVNLSR